MDNRRRISFSIFLLSVLTLLGVSVAVAESTAEVHMSVAPGGGAETAIQSGTARVYAVLHYEEMANAELEVNVYGAGGVVVFEQSDIYGGSGQEDIEIAGRDVLAGYISAAQRKTEDLTEAIGLAREATRSYIKRSRTGTAVGVVQSLQRVLTVLESYELSLTTLDELDSAQALASDVEDRGLEIMNGEVPDDQLDTALDELGQLVTETTAAVNSAVEGIDTGAQQPWLDGAYTTTLTQNGLIKDGFDWEISPEGTAGPQLSPTATPTAEPTSTPTPTQTQEPTATGTARPATATAMATASPTLMSPVPATPTVTPTRQRSGGQTATPSPSATVPRPSQGTPSTTVPPPTATPTSISVEPTPTPGDEKPAQVVSTPVEGAANTPEAVPDTAEGGATPGARAVTPEDVQPGDSGGEREMAAPAEFPSAAPLAPQEVRQLPVVRIAAIVSALTLGIVALWLRARV